MPEKNHFQNDARLNSFYLDPKTICLAKLPTRLPVGQITNYQLPGSLCQQNPDGSYNFTLTLYFKPQSYVYLGLIISGITFLTVIVSLAYLSVKGLTT